MKLKDTLIKPLAFANESLSELTGSLKILSKRTEKIINPKKAKQSNKKPKICYVYLASPTKELHSIGFMNFKTQIRKFEVLKKSIKTIVEYLPNYPILIFHEDFTEKDKTDLIKTAKDRKVKFITVDFDHYKGHRNLNTWMKTQNNFVEGRPAGYRMMCRFFSQELPRHIALDNFDYYVRLDHDSFFIKPKKLDIEECIKKYNFDYLYRSVWTDHKEKESIWEFTKSYAKKNHMALDGFRKLKLLNLKGDFNGRSPYTNFHISKVSFWRRNDVQKFIDEMEKVNGIICTHWQDTNVQMVALGLFNATVVEKTDFGYMHNLHYSILGSLKIKFLKNGDKLIK